MHLHVSAHEVCLAVNLPDGGVSVPVVFLETNFPQYDGALTTTQTAGVVTFL